ncbi:ammonia-dependent NAD(+) synthetase [Pseudomonas sp. KB-10]|uniref:ammonia-dependent NAD(+) synthetase n=1 Tax=Pseudomonas sp. KB-10 TaxID=2292264 RepID=UPI001BB01EB8|nr:ammonia-dependent NAD(+) synthetase [Pseudomonas sp. KB-10]
MSNRQAEIAAALDVVPPFADDAALSAEIERRKTFIKNTLKQSGLKVLVLGISGGVDSTTAGRLAQLSVEELRAETGDAGYRFIAVRLPHNTQHDEHDAQASLDFIGADEVSTVNIADSVNGLAQQVSHLQQLSDARRDFVVGNVKARIRMVAQFTIANASNGLVIGTDHAAEAVMGFFTKFGDGACDLAPLSGLVKHQVRAIAAQLGAPEHLVQKTPTADLEELRPGKPDEEAHGVSYAEIDAFLHGQKVSDEAYATIVRTYDASRHKRELPLAP